MRTIERARTLTSPANPSTSTPHTAAPGGAHDADATAKTAPAGRFARLSHLAGRSFIPLGLFARLPLAMLTVGTLTMVTSVSGSYALGGTAAGAVGIGSAMGAPLLGALADRQGQRPVLLASAVLNTVAVIALVLATAGLDAAGTFYAGVLAASFAAGASSPQVGPLARVRWMALTSEVPAPGSKRDLDTALSYESTADEVTFVLGPALVGILASLLAPWLPLALAAAMTIILVPAFANHPTRHAVRPLGKAARAAGGSRGRDRIPRAAALPVLTMVCMGTFFGATQAGLSSFSAGLSGSELAGLLYAVMGLSSAAAALSVAYWPRRFSLCWRWVLSAVLMAALAVLLLVPSSLAGMVAVLLVLGLPVGPVMVTVFAAGGVLAPAGRLGTVMTALASGIVAGTALGSSLGGQLAESGGYHAAFLVPVGAALMLALLGAWAAAVLRRGQER
ncbi:MFS transporter [Pseudarthrobacter sp. NamE2]|uniref:MFS transporter n=1 Tax=Pseudarthrobacter sp. NamE2 TaxID=2576838 RepID=UPI0010FD0FFC|nr:MFS transporter [Pseudarthrobacter sp. NamE2]TLM82385.1 MFS transporter [Pseudarthrobacter sp. NamE2]